MKDIENILDYWLKQLVDKVTNRNDGLSKQDRIEGCKKSIVRDIQKLYGGEK